MTLYATNHSTLIDSNSHEHDVMTCGCEGCAGERAAVEALYTAENAQTGLGDKDFGTVADFASFMGRVNPSITHDGVITVALGANTYDTDGISGDHRTGALEAMKLFKALFGVSFQETDSGVNGEINFSDDESGAFASMNGGIINVASTWSASNRNTLSYFTQTYVHELGHSLGLSHTGDYNGSWSEEELAYGNDSWQMSVMSYLSQSTNSFVEGNARLFTPFFGVADLYSLDQTLGARGFSTANAFTGDTVYGFNTNISSEVSAIYAEISTFTNFQIVIADGAGNDTLDFSGWADDQDIDLRASEATSTTPSLSFIGASSVIIAVGTVIENIRTGAGDDEIQGNEADNRIETGNGTDVVYGGGGSDTYVYNAASDTLVIQEISDTQVRVQDTDGAWDTLYDMEFIEFADGSTLAIGGTETTTPPTTTTTSSPGSDGDDMGALVGGLLLVGLIGVWLL